MSFYANLWWKLKKVNFTNDLNIYKNNNVNNLNCIGKSQKQWGVTLRQISSNTSVVDAEL